MDDRETKSMKIQFCDLCNESVPEGDFESGRAVLRKGRVVCATCDALMSGEEEGQAAPVLVEQTVGAGAAASPAPHHPTTPVRRRRGRRSGGGFIAFLALVVACGGSWFLWKELGALREVQREQGREFGDRLEETALGLDTSSRHARQRSAALELRLREEYGSQLTNARQELATLRGEVETAMGAQQALSDELRKTMDELTESDLEVGERLDELVARTIKSREEFALLFDRLVEAETAIASGAMAPPPPVAVSPAAPEWAGELAGLSSENAGKRWNAVTALGDTGDPAVVPHLVPLISDTDVFVRMAVARVFGDLGAPEAIDALIAALEDEEAVVREAAMVSLHAITGRNFRFDPMASAAVRAKKVKEWRTWWEKARSEYLGGA